MDPMLAENWDRVESRFSQPRALIERRTDNPVDAIWRELERFAGDAGAARIFRAREWRPGYIGDGVWGPRTLAALGSSVVPVLR